MDTFLNIAVCDDVKAELELLSEYITRWGKNTGTACTLKRYSSAEAFLFDYEEDQRTDILILDIQMKEMNGMELAKKLYREGSKIQYIFVTGMKQYVFEGYSVEAVSYLLKPVKAEELFRCLTLCLERLRKNPCILLEDGNTLQKVPLYDISYLESAGHYTYFYGDGWEYRSNKGISVYEEELKEAGFFRLHRSYIINLAKVECITKKEVTVGSTQIPIARGQWESLNKAYLAYHRSRCQEGDYL